ncbi:hypothetical protein OSB04_025139 [Centaurea solstitialis]|uniref:Reverse transcriptase Ty1/copia-type domain-containing protein n=1 Tax=Centaurea solstitialis TaxID=347529 RepID=A0AA38W3S3_9ASTR|nr:hypothetical protein OSB04_025139 [Centaurea solstitialis]
MCKEFEELMHKKFKMSSMGELTFFLGLQVKQKRDGIFINQSKYVATMLQKFGMNDAKPASTPMETHKHLTADVEGEEVDVHQYRSMIGSLMYLTASRPDIMFAVCVCARFQVRPKESHLHAVKRIFKYLKGQPRLGLWYRNDTSFDLVAYTDSDYGGANLDRKSTSGGCQFLGGRLVSWQCKKQTTVSQSTTEAEYIAASQCCSQVLWIQNQMQDYSLSFLQTPIYIDNNSAISIVNNPVKHSKTKHIEIKYHLIRDCNEKKLIQVLKVHTDDQYADLFTKAFDVGSLFTKGERRSEFKVKPVLEKEVVNEPVQHSELPVNEIPEVVMDSVVKGENEKEDEKLNEETQVADEPVVDIAELELQKAEPEINEDDLTIAELLVKMPEVVKPTKGVVFKELEVVKKNDLPVDPKDKGKEKMIEEAESDSDTVVDEAKRKVLEYEASEALARKLSLEDQERVNKEIEERKRKQAQQDKDGKDAAKKLQERKEKKPVKKTQKKSISKTETEKRRTMVRYLSSALGKPVQFFSRWNLEEIENKYNVTREAMHLEAMEEQHVETEEVALVQRKRKRDQIEEQVTTEGNPEHGVEKIKETVADSEQQVVQVIEKKEEIAEKTIEKEVEVTDQIEAQPSKAKRKKSIAKRPKMNKEIEEPSNISMWIYFENNQVDYFKVFRSDGTNEVFTNYLGIFRKLSKGDLKKMYEIACTKEIEDFEEARMLVEDLKMMFAFSKTKAELKKNRKRDQDDSIGEGKVISWNTYENRVFSVMYEKGRMSFFLMDKRYDFEPIMMGSMLEVKKKAENLSELDKELIERLREQLLELNANYFDEEVIELKQKKVTGWGVDQNLRYVVQLDDGSELCDSEWENILEECTRENLKEMYEQRCTVIKVAMNDRDDPDQAKRRKFALECLFWLFEPFKLLGVKNSNCEDVKEWRWFEKCKVYSVSINDGEMEYYFEECETDALDIQRLQCMMKVNLSTSGEPTRAARLLVKKIKTYLKIRLTNLAPHVEKLSLGGDC